MRRIGRFAANPGRDWPVFPYGRGSINGGEVDEVVAFGEVVAEAIHLGFDAEPAEPTGKGNGKG